MTTMPAVGSFAGLPVDDPDSLRDIEIAVPELRPHDILVRVLAVSVNPVDVKRRAALPVSRTPVILGHDAAGIVEAVGPAVTTFEVVDEVWYAGDISRPGTNAQFHAVDERIAARKPQSLSFDAAAALPLTTITAWETLFERFALTADSTGDLLVLGGGGGVGSIMIQLAKALTGVRVIATAGRADSRAWALEMGADVVIDHHHLGDEAIAAAPEGIDYVFSPHSAGNIDNFARIVRPFGHITAIDEPPGLDLLALKQKSIAWHWELMFTRPLFGSDLTYQQNLLTRTAQLVDAGVLRSTATTVLSGLDAARLRDAHRAVESGHTTGKVVVART
ncbi:zinc-binding alcohol dehydrogenase family protein [Nocardia cerradoensis]|uniref:Zinc-type alcohol dehydrogenase-like protein n=1 Tax=Nocardia cerradoensis TaxID=85688 RepID=A0A231HAZ4_9NOCA|nr:zinc-binding alcohol dehydrogenase family protein [Nocardia cerradoensis]NKY42985.1 zinc-binding alcohol dehydrogenase family protein [Nocardia cerradoensis]OXR46015.1 Zinc-type alcohol dehydrogenase-like protein [Nocardia cerradoensis]